MNYRLSTIFAEKSYSADGTEVIDLNMIDPISQLIIGYKSNITDDTAITAHVAANPTKIELVDGSDVLFSLSGYEAEAVDWYHNHNFNSPWNIYMGWGETERFIRLNFGRYLWDPELAFDPKKFRNPQLKVSWDYNAGGGVPTTFKFRVLAALFDEKIISPIGFLMHKEIKSYTATASAHEYTDLPIDFPYRKLLIRCLYPGTEPGQILSNFKLSEDQDRRIIVNHETEDILRTIAMVSPEIEEYIHARVATSATHIYCTPAARVYAVATELGDTSGSGAIATGMGDGGLIHAIAATAQKYAQFFVKGFLPHGAWEIPFGLQNEIDDWYDVASLGSLRLDITAGAHSATTPSAQVFLQQLRKY
jgi:hypothetical protein